MNHRNNILASPADRDPANSGPALGTGESCSSAEPDPEQPLSDRTMRATAAAAIAQSNPAAQQAQEPHQQAKPSARETVAATRVLSIHIVPIAGDWSKFGNLEELIHQTADVLARHREFCQDLPASATLALGDDQQVRNLNHQFRGKDRATNVLSFPAAAAAEHPPNCGCSGAAS